MSLSWPTGYTISTMPLRTSFETLLLPLRTLQVTVQRGRAGGAEPLRKKPFFQPSTYPVEYTFHRACPDSAQVLA